MLLSGRHAVVGLRYCRGRTSARPRSSRIVDGFCRRPFFGKLTSVGKVGCDHHGDEFVKVYVSSVWMFEWLFTHTHAHTRTDKRNNTIKWERMREEHNITMIT